MVADLECSQVLYLADDRKQESLDGVWATLTPEQRAGIQVIAMDMWEPYIQSTCAHCDEAEAKIVFPNSMSPSISMRLWTKCGGRNTGRSSSTAMLA